MNLTDWKVKTAVKDLDGAKDAETRIFHPYHEAICVLSVDWLTHDMEYSLDELASHEVMHMVVADCVYALWDAVVRTAPNSLIPSKDGAEAVRNLWMASEESLVDYVARSLVTAYAREDGKE